MENSTLLHQAFLVSFQASEKVSTWDDGSNKPRTVTQETRIHVQCENESKHCAILMVLTYFGSISVIQLVIMSKYGQKLISPQYCIFNAPKQRAIPPNYKTFNKNNNVSCKEKIALFFAGQTLSRKAFSGTSQYDLISIRSADLQTQQQQNLSFIKS